MKFSILINTHNQEKYLNKAIMSCIKQNFKNYEIIVCDTSDKKNNIINKRVIYNKKFQYFHLSQKYKSNFLFNIFVNDWPQVYGTSSILIKKEILQIFFKKAKPFTWRYLAIDAQLAIFCKINFRVTEYFGSITKKNIHNKNLGNDYLGLFRKKFWVRRYMQHKYYMYIKKEKKINIDYIFTTIAYYFFKNL